MTSPPSRKPPLFPFALTHTHLVRLNRLLINPTSLDKTLCTVTYTLNLLSSILPSDALFRSLRNLSALIDDHRIFARLSSLPSLILSSHATLTRPPTDFVLRQIAYFQVMVDITYQVLENGAYLASKGVVTWSKERQERAWLWSSRFWAMSVGCDLIRLLHSGPALSSSSRLEKLDGGRMGEVEAGEKEEKIKRKLDRKWWTALATNMAWLPLTIHWSVEGGLLGQGMVGALGLCAGGLGLVETWRATN